MAYFALCDPSFSRSEWGCVLRGEIVNFQFKKQCRVQNFGDRV